MTYDPIVSPEQKAVFTKWLQDIVQDLNGRLENQDVKDIFPHSKTGDIGTVKDIVGNFLASLTGKPVTIE